MELFSIACSFQTHEGTEPIHGIAICTDPNTPVTFIYPNGKPYDDHGAGIWNYKLKHYEPWTKIGY